MPPASTQVPAPAAKLPAGAASTARRRPERGCRCQCRCCLGGKAPAAPLSPCAPQRRGRRQGPGRRESQSHGGCCRRWRWQAAAPAPRPACQSKCRPWRSRGRSATCRQGRVGGECIGGMQGRSRWVARGGRAPGAQVPRPHCCRHTPSPLPQLALQVSPLGVPPVRQLDARQAVAAGQVRRSVGQRVGGPAGKRREGRG